MPEANVLYSVTAVVVVGLVAWVALVLKSAKEPWARPAVPQPLARTEDVPVEGDAAEADEAKAEAKADEPADEAKAKADEPADEAKAEAKADEPEPAKADEPTKADEPAK